MATKVNSFELLNHGIQQSSYFQGCGTSFTSFENVVTGVGDNPAEATEDCFEQMAQYASSNYFSRESIVVEIDFEDLEKRILEENSIDKLPTEPDKCEGCDCNKEEVDNSECDMCETYYHVSIRWNMNDVCGGCNENHDCKCSGKCEEKEPEKPLTDVRGRKIISSCPEVDGSRKTRDEIFQAELAKERYPCGHDFS